MYVVPLSIGMYKIVQIGTYNKGTYCYLCMIEGEYI